MKKSAIIALLCLATQSFATTLTQSIVAGTASSSGNPASQATPAAGFVSNTQPGSLIIGIVYFGQTASTGNFGAGSSIGCAIDNAHGFGFSATGGAQWEGGTVGSRVRQGGICIKFMTNAATILNTATTFATCSYPSSGGNWSGTCELHLYEFAINSTADGGVVGQSQAVGTPLSGTNKTTTNATDLIFSVYSSDPSVSSYATAGAGYTLGLATTVSGVGQLQWQYVTSTGTYSLSFSGAGANDGIGEGIAFKQIGPIGGNGVTRHKGYVF